ncbi:hypothetical protein [Saccharothrix sp. ALI-22-I]|nr:hypothetical protein [Saccharothrix sp. ALI-22-I]
MSAHNVFLVDVSWDFTENEAEPYVLTIYFNFEPEPDEPTPETD